MFTVVICNKHIIEDCCERFKIYFKPLLDKEDVSFCSWNPYAGSLDSSVEHLRELINGKKEWRAVIICDSASSGLDAVNKDNPFDFVEPAEDKVDFSDYDAILAAREAKRRMYERASGNPLAELAIRLCGAPVNTPPVLCYESIRAELDGAEDKNQYFSLLKRNGLDAADVEYDKWREIRYSVLSGKFELDGELFCPPSSVIALAERASTSDAGDAKKAWSARTEFEYSSFYLDNLYPERLRYSVFDIDYIRGQRKDADYFRFLTCALLLSAYDAPSGAFRPNRVYRLEIQVDFERMKKLCDAYAAKLRATLVKIDDMSEKLKRQQSTPVKRGEVETVVDSKIEIPIDVFSNVPKEAMLADSRKIGLSGDCPEDEVQLWGVRRREISKNFTRFLREPRRAVKQTVGKNFKNSQTIDEECAARFNETQLEDVAFALEEAERSMVLTETVPLFNSERYKQRMEKEAEAVDDVIGKRVTKKKTLAIGIISLIGVLLSVLPLIFSNLTKWETAASALIIAVAVILLFLAVGIIYLFVLRNRLKKSIRTFNRAMESMLSEISDGVDTFSVYLGHAAEVMRDFSVLSRLRNPYERKQRLLLYHKSNIFSLLNNIKELFADMLEPQECAPDDEASAYDYDFTVGEEYAYDLPYAPQGRDIDFLQTGNKQRVPIDFVSAVLLNREELYD